MMGRVGLCEGGWRLAIFSHIRMLLGVISGTLRRPQRRARGSHIMFSGQIPNDRYLPR
jgi:hypothetical protein